ncbi:ABC transporter ATP-binding protein [Pseudonocardia sp. GCM10023141]|uniref:ABC transporter ATP-binding protein n=1 Tax=Pseudonocardia sp. GCM10023141 TaxID=3252653 RepID=UPI003620E446
MSSTHWRPTSGFSTSIWGGTMLELEGVQAGYPDQPVLHGVDLTVRTGERLAVLGRNGVGKTTLVRAVVGAIPVTAGKIRLDGERIDRLAAHKRVGAGIAHVPQGRGIFGELSILENLKVSACAVHGAGWRREIQQILEEFPMLAERAGHAARSLSGGQQQVLAIARALLTRPRLLVLDEPTEGIQPSILDTMADLLVDVNVARGVTLVVVEQKIDFAARLAERAVVVDRGRIHCAIALADLQGSRELQRELLAV